MSRDPRLDFFRGLALLAIGLNHCFAPPGMRHYQFGQLFAFNFADVFVFISGLVCGGVYLRVHKREALAGCLRKAGRRCLSIVVANGAAAAACTLLVAGFATAGVTAQQHHLGGRSALDAWLGTTLLYDPLPYFNILNLYVVLLLLLPFMLALYLRVGRWALLLAALPWAAANLLPLEAWGRFAWLATEGPFFGGPLAWQLLFYLGLALGVERGGRSRLPVAWATLIALLVLIAGDYLSQVRLAIHHLDAKATLGPARIAELLAVAYLCAQVLRPDSRFFELFWTRAIVACGRNSLVVFCVSLVAAYLASLTAAALEVGRVGYVALLVGATGLNLASARLRIAWLDARPKPRAADHLPPASVPS